MAPSNLLHKILRLGPMGLGAFAVAVLAVGFYLQISENARALVLVSRVSDDMTIFGLASKISGAIGLLALATLVIKPQAQMDDPMPEAQDDTDQLESAAIVPNIAPRQTRTAPLWKQRSGLVTQEEVDAQIPAFDASAFEGADVEDVEIIQPRARFGLRKVMIGLVGGLFVLGLGATITDQVAKSARAEAAQVQPIEQVVATIAADAIVPDADPNRHWTDIDVTPIVEWFTAHFLLAVAGDGDAQLMLCMIFGGLVALMITIRFFFSIRKAMRPKTTANFASMGIN